MAVLGKSKLFASSKFDSHVTSANTTGWEKWLGYFFGPMGAAILNFTIISYITVFYTDVLNMADPKTHSALWLAVFAAFPIVSKIIDAVTNIVMGQIIEKTRTRQGKARPWIFLSAPLLSLACIAMFLVPEESSTLQLVLVVLTYNVFFSFAYTIYNMSHTLMVPLSTSNVKQRDTLALFTNMGVNMLPGSIIALLFPAVLMPVLGFDYKKWMTAMIIIAAIALPFTVLEYFFTTERVTEAAVTAGDVKTVSFKEQLRVCFSSRPWVLMILFMLVFQVMSNFMTISLPYFCNWVLGTYNDGTTQMLLSAVGKAPLGFGVFLLWPLVRKFGKRRVMIVGFFIAAAAELLCWIFSKNMGLMLVGSAIYAIGFLPSYVYSALMADTLDYVEYKSSIRADGLTASIFTIIMTVSVGIGQGIFNLGLSATGYEAPRLISEGVYNVQNAATQNFITLAYIGIPMIGLILMSVIMIFLRVEDQLPMIHEELTARRKADAEARGEVYLSPEEKEALEQEENDRIAEENRIKELKERCAKKGLNFDEEEAKYQAKLAEKKAKEAAKAAKKNRKS
ncbi:MAG: MFS transporter [Lachnospiraceae bacterium]|nr:MFS transporter [Lachnospiraceae bacterium]